MNEITLHGTQRTGTTTDLQSTVDALLRNYIQHGVYDHSSNTNASSAPVVLDVREDGSPMIQEDDVLSARIMPGPAEHTRLPYVRRKMWIG